MDLLSEIPKNKPVRLIGINKYITKNKHAEEELIAAKE